MSDNKQSSSNDDVGNISPELVEDIEKQIDNDEASEDKWVFRKLTDHLATVLRPGVIRPLSPTLKVYSPDSVFPGIAMIHEGFDDMREWRNTIEFVGFFAKKLKNGNLFNSYHHWNMRTTFLKARLGCMKRIIEDPDAVPRKPEGKFFLRIPIVLDETMSEDRKPELASERERYLRKKDKRAKQSFVKQQKLSKQNLQDYVEGKDDTKDDNDMGKPAEITTEADSNVHGRGHDDGNNKYKNIELCSTRSPRSKHGRRRRKIFVMVPKNNNKLFVTTFLKSHGRILPVRSTSYKDVMKKLEQFEGQDKIESERMIGEDEKLKRESLQKGLNIESQREKIVMMPSTSAGSENFPSNSALSSGSEQSLPHSALNKGCEQFPRNTESVQDLIVIGEAIKLSLPADLDEHSISLSAENECVNVQKETSSKEETSSYQVKETLVLEDVSDKDCVPDVIIPPPSCKLQQTTVMDASDNDNTAEQHPTRLQRLRRRIRRALFFCFGRNQVTPL